MFRLQKMDQRKERLAQAEDASARMADNGQQFGDAAADLANCKSLLMFSFV